MTVYKNVTPSQLAQAVSVSQGGKRVLNNTGFTIQAGKPLSWEEDGSITLASALTTTLSDFAGISSGTIPNGTYGTSTKVGTAMGVIAELNAEAGEVIYLGIEPGTYSKSAPTDLDEGAVILKLGRAEPADQTITPIVDLFIEVEEIAII